jgi:hypothetical protein
MFAFCRCWVVAIYRLINRLIDFNCQFCEAIGARDNFARTFETYSALVIRPDEFAAKLAFDYDSFPACVHFRTGWI